MSAVRDWRTFSLAPRTRGQRLLLWTVAVSGFAVIATVFIFYPVWADMLVWDRTGDDIRNGISPYLVTGIGVGFYYAPPWAIALAALTWMPAVVLHALITVAEIAALRYLTGSWLWAGVLGWAIPMWREVQVGQVNVLLAASIAAACRGDPRGAVAMSFAKISPIIAVRPRDWRPALLVTAIMVAVTLPWLSLWVDWVHQLVISYGTQIAPANVQLTIPYPIRLVAALGVLLLVRRPWGRAAAAILALPAIYWPTSLLVLLAFLPLLRDERAGAPASPGARPAPDHRVGEGS